MRSFSCHFYLPPQEILSIMPAAEWAVRPTMDCGVVISYDGDTPTVKIGNRVEYPVVSYRDVDIPVGESDGHQVSFGGFGRPLRYHPSAESVPPGDGILVVVTADLPDDHAIQYLNPNGLDNTPGGTVLAADRNDALIFLRKGECMGVSLINIHRSELWMLKNEHGILAVMRRKLQTEDAA